MPIPRRVVYKTLQNLGEKYVLPWAAEKAFKYFGPKKGNYTRKVSDRSMRERTPIRVQIADVPRGRPKRRRAVSLQSASRPRANSAGVQLPRIKRRFASVRSELNSAAIANIPRGRYSSGRSDGFVTTGKFKQSRSSVTGINYTGEFGGTTSDVDMIVIGHSTAPTGIIYNQVWAAVIKKLFRLADYDILDPSVDIPVVGQIAITWKRHSDDAVQLETMGVGYEQTYPTFKALMFGLCGSAMDFNSNSGSDVQSVEFLAITFTPATPPEGAFITMHESRMRLDETIVSLSMKSTLKMQNRTVNTAGEDENAVDNVPLYGKSYEGSGSGPYWINVDNDDTSFMANRDTGVIKTARPGEMKEPPKPSEFKGTQKTGKIRVEPGHIKTSVLTAYASHKLATWYRMCVPFEFIDKAKTHFGKYRFFCIEKILDPDHVASINCAFEHNLAITSNAKLHKTLGTIALYQSAYNL